MARNKKSVRRNTPEAEQLGIRWKKCREAAGFKSQSALSEELLKNHYVVCRTDISKIENGHIIPSDDLVKIASSIFEVEPAFLTGKANYQSIKAAKRVYRSQEETRSQALMQIVKSFLSVNQYKIIGTEGFYYRDAKEHWIISKKLDKPFDDIAKECGQAFFHPAFVRLEHNGNEMIIDYTDLIQYAVEISAAFDLRLQSLEKSSPSIGFSQKQRHLEEQYSENSWHITESPADILAEQDAEQLDNEIERFKLE